MGSFLDLPLDIVSLISIRAKVVGWLALSRTCRRFSELGRDGRRTVILSGLVIETVSIMYPSARVWNLPDIGKFHREYDLPAVISASIGRRWYKYGKLHRRDDSPAHIGANGTKAWYQHGQLHRDTEGPDGNVLPAVIYSTGTKEWFLRGESIKRVYLYLSLPDTQHIYLKMSIPIVSSFSLFRLIAK